MPLGEVLTHSKLNRHDSQTCAAAEPSRYRMRVRAPARMTGRIHSEVTAMCISVWNQFRFERALDRAPESGRPELFPGTGHVADRIDHQGQQHEPQQTPDHPAVSGSDPRALHTSLKCQPQRKPHRKQKLRHDRVGIADVIVMMLQHARGRVEPADEVHQQHSDHGVPPN